MPPYGSCLLGSVNLTKFVENPFTDKAKFNFAKFDQVVTVFTRMLDNVVEINGLPLKNQEDEIRRKRRHGMGYLGLGSTISMLGMTYGDDKSVSFTKKVSHNLAQVGWNTGVLLAKEKGPAPIFEETFTVTEKMLSQRPELRSRYQVGQRVLGKELFVYGSRYMQKFGSPESEDLLKDILAHGCRFTHATSIAPTGTISLSLGNNASNGIEPSFSHIYSRNVIRDGKKSKEKVDVLSFELLAYRHFINPDAMPEDLPENCVTSDNIPALAHVKIQAAAQPWIDSSISKTINVPTDYDFDDFGSIYLKAVDDNLKGCTTFRFNPEAFQGVLVKEDDLKNTFYEFITETGEIIKVAGNEMIEYDGELHTAANLYDALKEGYYGKF